MVDITTKDLYDKIEFSDVDGGPWKQGWRVSYKGNEWDSEKLKIFVVPHSHNDPGWKLTVEEYYERQSRHILDTIVDTLSKVNWVLLLFLFSFFGLNCSGIRESNGEVGFCFYLFFCFVVELTNEVVKWLLLLFFFFGFLFWVKFVV